MSEPGYIEKLRNHYTPLIREHGSSHQAVDWGSEAGQDLRLKVLLEIADLHKATLLDVGCGVGRMAEFLKKTTTQATYLGTDLLEEMIECAKASHPGWDFRALDALDPARHISADYVFGSGLFTFSNEAHMKEIILGMFRSCKKGVAVNSLSSWAPSCEPGEFQADPLKILEFCHSLTPLVTLRHDYMKHDFTIYLYK